MTYLLLILVTFAIGFGAQGYVNHQLNKYSHVPNTSQMTGRDVAVGMLNYYGIQGVEVRMGREGQDFFNPKDNSITLGPDSYNGRSITATATACHEVGHACQFAQDYKPMKVRSALVPVVNLASNTWIFILLAGIILNVIGLVDVAIALYAVAVLFQIVTLPVEFDASRRRLPICSRPVFRVVNKQVRQVCCALALSPIWQRRSFPSCSCSTCSLRETTRRLR